MDRKEIADYLSKNQKLIRYWCDRLSYVKKKQYIEDLVNEANLKILERAVAFDELKSSNFSGYIIRMMVHCIAEYQHRNMLQLTYPVNFYRSSKKFKELQLSEQVRNIDTLLESDRDYLNNIAFAEKDKIGLLDEKLDDEIIYNIVNNVYNKLKRQRYKDIISLCYDTDTWNISRIPVEEISKKVNCSYKLVVNIKYKFNKLVIKAINEYKNDTKGQGKRTNGRRQKEK